ncbi:peptidoglycan/LPS O-acetylase OafA/YrhL [Thermasporomyces composti]|uniref:Peptidoglycan/LPS O-acetylase OafA/YrhL n=1 Tax=Thermasporomyces composti TaxID=696763 RepID=A0A3D9VCB2_THECX|nr:peptidoglycan/LPS O-acetylase OafA/YrhL [Thermasporomyces composti]
MAGPWLRAPVRAQLPRMGEGRPSLRPGPWWPSVIGSAFPTDAMSRGTTMGDVVPARRTAHGRDPYLDLLRALALVRVLVYHAFGWAWLTFAFPAMGVMFALAGSLMARSLDARPPISVVGGRLRRLLPPFWAFGLFVVPAMLLQGWSPAADDSHGDWWAKLVYWLFPLNDPPGSAEASQVVTPLWYVRAYLWFVLLSPVLLLLFRRWPWPTVTGSLVLVGLLQAGLFPLSAQGLSNVVWTLAIFGACWLVGFAHRDGLVDRLPHTRVLALVAGALLVGGVYALTHPGDQGYDLGGIPVAQAFWSFGFVLLLLRFRPRDLRWLARLPGVEALVSLLNQRAVTFYLWHQVALIGAVLLIDQMWAVPAFQQALPLGTDWWKLVVTCPLIVVALLAFGWVEDLAARRPPRLWPVTGRRTTTPGMSRRTETA